jgi:hypothetical protein
MATHTLIHEPGMRIEKPNPEPDAPTNPYIKKTMSLFLSSMISGMLAESISLSAYASS